MNQDRKPTDESSQSAVQDCGTLTAAQKSRFFDPTDWLSFSATTIVSFAVYFFTLAPQVTLESNGIFSTGAFYTGVHHPPGYPLWTIYAWLFTALLPLSNIAWRVAVSSAVAGALACGLLALIVSRGGMLLLDSISEFKRLSPKQERSLRVASGCGGWPSVFPEPFGRRRWSPMYGL